MSASSPAPAAVRIAVPAGTTGAEAVEAAKLPTHGPHAIVVVRAPDGTLKDLDWRPDSDVEVEAVAIDSPDGLNVLRHSTAHVMAQAVQDLHPDARLGIGPPIKDGFYYDFGVETPFVPDDLAAIEVADEGDRQGGPAVPPPRVPLRRRPPARSWPPSRTSSS